MSYKLTIKPNTEELPGNGGGMGISYDERPDYPDNEENLKRWITDYCEMKQGTKTNVCEFRIKKGTKTIASGTIQNCETITWDELD